MDSAFGSIPQAKQTFFPAKTNSLDLGFKILDHVPWDTQYGCFKRTTQAISIDSICRSLEIPISGIDPFNCMIQDIFLCFLSFS